MRTDTDDGRRTTDDERKQGRSLPARPHLSSWMQAFVLRLSSFVFLGLLVCWLTLLPPQVQRVDVGSDGSELAYVRGVYQREKAADTTFRWVSGQASIELPTGQVGTTLLEARLHGAPDLKGGTLPVTLTLGTGQVLHLVIPEGERVYRLPLPTDASGMIRAQLDGATVIAPGDDRRITFALDWITARPIDSTARPAWTLVAEEGLLLASGLALLLALRVPTFWQIGGGVLLIAALAALNLSLRLWIATAALSFSLATFGLAALTIYAQPALARALGGARSRISLAHAATYSRLLWAIVLGGAVIRLLGVLAPGFEAHDLDIQAQQFSDVVTGLLYFTVHSHEWAGAATFYPPGPYLLLAPLRILLPSVALTLQVGAALADAAGPLLLALIARRLGASQRMALLAALLLAGLPIQFTALWWGFFTNAIGQVLVLALVWSLLEYAAAPARSRLALVGIITALVLLSHAGVLIMAGTLIALVLGYLFIDERPFNKLRAGSTTDDRRRASISVLGSRFSVLGSPIFRSLFLTLFGVGLAVGLLYFSVIVIPMIVEAFTIAGTRSDRDPARSAAFRAYVIDIQPVKLWRGLVGFPALLLVPGLILLWQRARQPLGRALLVAWPLVPLVFFVVDVIFLVQARYVYFAAPVCVLGLAAFLDRIPASRAGRIVVWTIVLMIVATGCILWLDGALLGDKPSLVPLSH